MIATDIFQTINFYRHLLEKIKKENLNPFDISIQELKELTGDNLFTGNILLK